MVEGFAAMSHWSTSQEISSGLLMMFSGLPWSGFDRKPAGCQGTAASQQGSSHWCQEYSLRAGHHGSLGHWRERNPTGNSLLFSTPCSIPPHFFIDRLNVVPPGRGKMVGVQLHYYKIRQKVMGSMLRGKKLMGTFHLFSYSVSIYTHLDFNAITKQLYIFTYKDQLHFIQGYSFYFFF
jgi:hypothetical protein